MNIRCLAGLCAFYALLISIPARAQDSLVTYKSLAPVGDFGSPTANKICQKRKRPKVTETYNLHPFWGRIYRPVGSYPVPEDSARC
jgi:hypothetical protein